MVLLAGIGNCARSDDALGLLVAREFARRCLEGVEVAECAGNVMALIDLWEGYDAVVIVDAIRSGEAAGFVHLVDVTRDGIPEKMTRPASHVFGLAAVVALARELGRLPPQLFLAGIEAGELGQGMGLSDKVVRSMGELIMLVEHKLKPYQRSIPNPTPQ